MMNRPEVLTLINQVHTKKENGFEETTETKTDIFCNWRDGVGFDEFYTSRKAGLKASASAEVFFAEYEGQEFVEFKGQRYSVIRAYQNHPDYKILVLQEVVR